MLRHEYVVILVERPVLITPAVNKERGRTGNSASTPLGCLAALVYFSSDTILFQSLFNKSQGRSLSSNKLPFSEEVSNKNHLIKLFTFWLFMYLFVPTAYTTCIPWIVR